MSDPRSDLAMKCGALLMVAADRDEGITDVVAGMREVLDPIADDPRALVWCVMYLSIIGSNAINLLDANGKHLTVHEIAASIQDMAARW